MIPPHACARALAHAKRYRTPLLFEVGEEEDTDSTTESPRNNRAASGGSWPRPPSSARGKGGGGSGGGGVVAPRVPVPPALQWPGALASALPRVPSRDPPQIGDYRSEGEQPSTERDGSRRPLADAPRQDSFRTNRQPKRGGRKRLRRNMGRATVRRRKVKIRVSSYCVARGLHTIELLRWLESQPNRQLSQSLLARGNGSPPDRKEGLEVGGSGSSSAVAADSDGGVAAGGNGAPSARKDDGQGLEGGSSGGGGANGAVDVGVDVESAGASRGGVPAPAGSGVDGLEWMDSLYIDVIHSTTDIKGGLRKARDLERPAWDGDEDMDGEGDGGYAGGGGGGHGDGYGYGDEPDEDGGPWERAAADGGETEEREQRRGAADVVTRHKDVVFFPYGAVVFWGCSEAEVCLDRFRSPHTSCVTVFLDNLRNSPTPIT